MKIVIVSDNDKLLHVIEIAKALGAECSIEDGDAAAVETPTEAGSAQAEQPAA